MKMILGLLIVQLDVLKNYLLSVGYLNIDDD